MPPRNQERPARHLLEKGRGGVFFLHGDEEHLKEEAVRDLVDGHLDEGTRDFNLDEVRGGDVTPETLGSLIQTPPMMAEWRVVVVRETQGLAVSSTARKILEEAVSTPPPGLALVLAADTGGSKARIWKTLEKKARSLRFARLSDADLPGWLMDWAVQRDLTLDADAARAIATAIGADLATLSREMEKLRDFVGDRGTITLEDVSTVVGVLPRQDRWKWFDLVAERRFDEAWEGLHVLLDGPESGVGLVIGLGTQFLRLGTCVEGGKAALESALPRHQRWLAGRIQGQARRWTGPAIRQAIEDLRRADRLLKSAPLSDTQIMEELLLRLQHAPKAAA